MEALEYFLKASETNINFICIVSIHYVPLILDVVRVVKKCLKNSNFRLKIVFTRLG